MFRVLALTACFASSIANADVVGPDVRSCPSGFPHQRCHGAEYCQIARCTDSTQCAPGSTCEDQRWCVWKLECGDRFRPDGYIPNYLYGYEGSCANGETCAKGSCETIRACTPQAQAASRGCSCSLAADAAPAPFALVVLALLALTARLRRR